MKRTLLALLLAVLPLATFAQTVPISGLPAGGAVSDTDVLPNTQGATTVKTTAAQLATYVFSPASITVGPVGTNTVLLGNAAATTTSNGGNLVMRASPGGTVSGNAGAAEINGGVAIDGVGGNATIRGSAGVGTNRAGGSVNALAGAATGTATGGGGSFTAGQGGATGAGGQFTITAGAGGATSGNGGSVIVAGGTPTDGNGGSVTLNGVNGVGTNRNGGNVNITTGAATGSGTAGTLNLNGTPLVNAGTFSMTATAGLASPPSVAAQWALAGNIAIVCTNTVGGTSNATNFTLGTIPAAARPASARATTMNFGTDNSVNGLYTAVVSNTGVLTLNFNGGSWTNTGTKASGNACFTYPIN